MDATRSLPEWVTRPTDVEAQEIREIYALTGLYMGQVLEHGLSNCLVLLDVARVRGGQKRFRSYVEFEKYLDNLEEQHFSRTLGALMNAIKSAGVVIPEGLNDNLAKSLRARNRLAHHFFRQHATDLLQPEGRITMAKELNEMRALFEATDGQLEPITMSLQTILGISEDAKDEFIAMMKRGVSESEIKAYIREKHKRVKLA